jgi:hypothetical protein
MRWENEREGEALLALSALSALSRLFFGVLVIAAESKSFGPLRSNCRSKHSAVAQFVMYPRED